MITKFTEIDEKEFEEMKADTAKTPPIVQAFEILKDIKVEEPSISTEEEIETLKERMKDGEFVQSMKLTYEVIQYMFERMSKGCSWHEGSKATGYSCDYDHKTDDRSRRDCLMNQCPLIR